MIKRYRELLDKCRHQFAFYAAQHRMKNTKEADAKADVNENLAADILLTLAAPVVETSHHEMVVKLQKPGEAILAQMTPLKIMCLHMAGGAASEGGELFDAIKRWALFGKELDRENVIEELGDLEFFMDGLRENLGITREETLVHNMAKLGVRYEGFVFSDEATIARADKQLGEPRQHADDADRRPLSELFDEEEQRLLGLAEGARLGGHFHVDDSATEAVADEFFGKTEEDKR